MSTPQTPLSRNEQMWVTERVNAPGWGVFYGIVAIVFGIVLAISSWMADISQAALIICLIACAFITGLGVWITLRAATRITPLQRLRRGWEPDHVDDVEIVSISDLRGMVLRYANGGEVTLRGPAPTPAEGRDTVPVSLGETVTLSSWVPANRSAPMIGRVDFSDGARAIGELEEPL